MDATQFDTLLRGLATAKSRRGAVMGLLGGALGLLGLTATEAKHKKKHHNEERWWLPTRLAVAVTSATARTAHLQRRSQEWQ